EERKMPDRDLSGDDLKLVRYKVLFTKRNFEHAFPEKEELVYDNMEATRFVAWKIAEFIQKLRFEEKSYRRIPTKLATYLLTEEWRGDPDARKRFEDHRRLRDERDRVWSERERTRKESERLRQQLQQPQPGA